MGRPNVSISVLETDGFRFPKFQGTAGEATAEKRGIVTGRTERSLADGTETETRREEDLAAKYVTLEHGTSVRQTL